jgi:hypothetical protein
MNDWNKAVRANHGKPRLSLLPPYACQEIAQVFGYGADKYTRRMPVTLELISELSGIDAEELVHTTEKTLSAEEASRLFDSYREYIPLWVQREGNELLVSGRDNWKLGLPLTSVLDSCLRHLMAWNAGKDRDSESGLLHLAHAAANIMMMMELEKNKPYCDDRPV